MQVLTAAHQGCNVIVWFAINIQLNQSSGSPMVSIQLHVDELTYYCTIHNCTIHNYELTRR